MPYMGFDIKDATNGSLQVYRKGELFSAMYFATHEAAYRAIDVYQRSLGKGDYPGYPLPIKEAQPIKQQHIFKLP